MNVLAQEDYPKTELRDKLMDAFIQPMSQNVWDTNVEFCKKYVK